MSEPQPLDEEECERLRREIEAQHHLFQVLLDTALEGIAIFDGRDLRVKWANPAYRQFLGKPYQSGDITGLHLQDFIPDAEESGMADIFRRVAATGRPYIDPEYEYAGFARGITYWRWSVLPLFAEEGGAPDLIVRLTEITEEVLTRKRAEKLAAEAEAQREELAEADRRKDEFLAMLSHELRNPLGALSNVVQVLHLHGAGDSICGQVHAILGRQVQHMTRLLDDLLDVSRITHGKIELHKEPVDLVVAVAHAVETTRPFIEARRHELQVSLPAEPVWLEADPTRLEQILINLLSNAAKYTEPGGRIWLTAEREGAEAVLRVRDSGVGISPELLQCVFDLFTQGDRSPDRSQGGLGIGLTLVRSLTEMHGGSVQACSAGPGQGSEFMVCLPALPSTVETEIPGPRSAGSERETWASHRRVLVVDDNVDAAKMLAMLLEMWGHQVWVAHDGPAAIEVAMNYRPAVVLLDIGLPRMDGYELARRLRQQVGLSEALLVALTGYGHEEARRRSREAGFNHHLVKPIGSAELRRLLTTLLEGL